MAIHPTWIVRGLSSTSPVVRGTTRKPLTPAIEGVRDHKIGPLTDVRAARLACSSAELRALSWRISIHALEYSLTISAASREPAMEYFLSFW